MNPLNFVILQEARLAGEKGALISDIMHAIQRADLFNWTFNGTIPTHTGASIFGRALASLIHGGFVRLSDKELSEKAIERHLSNASGYVLSSMMEDREHEIRVYLSDAFFNAQHCLGFSLTEAASRNERSVVATPEFKLSGSSGLFDFFVVMPFQAEFSMPYERILDSVRNCERTAGRGDDFFGSDYVIDDIWNAIYHANGIIADCTGRNANVFYELGIAHTLGRRTLLLAQNQNDIPFDLRHRRYHLYDTSDNGLATLDQAVQNFVCN